MWISKQQDLPSDCSLGMVNAVIQRFNESAIMTNFIENVWRGSQNGGTAAPPRVPDDAKQQQKASERY